MIGIAVIFCPLPSVLASSYGSYNQVITKAPANEVLQAGSVMPATLVTPMISDNLNAAVIAIIRQNIYDSVTGKNLLIPAGSKLIGEPLGMNGKRIDVTFTRIIFRMAKVFCCLNISRSMELVIVVCVINIQIIPG